jgi:hypothetical protein
VAVALQRAAFVADHDRGGIGPGGFQQAVIGHIGRAHADHGDLDPGQRLIH